MGFLRFATVSSKLLHEVTWGHSKLGGDCSDVKDQLRDVKQALTLARSDVLLRREGGQC